MTKQHTSCNKEDSSLTPELQNLKSDLIQTIQSQGFIIEDNKIKEQPQNSKDYIRKLNSIAIAHKINLMKKSLYNKEEHLISKFIANGNEIQPEKIQPELILVKRKSIEELLFRYSYCHWSIPVSAGYGRRLRYIVIDRQNNKLIGLIGLCDPVYSLSARDAWIGWDNDTKKNRIASIMDAFVLGSIPPYNLLLCGKLISILCHSKEIKMDFHAKYGSRPSYISNRSNNNGLALITTTSAFGKSSIYNRVKIKGEEFWKSIGFTKGSGEFHFSNGLYSRIFDFVSTNNTPKLKNQKWGTGWRNKREVMKVFLKSAGLPQSLLYHGVKRESYVAELATNSRDYLTGRSSCLDERDHNAQDLTKMALQRWIIPRAENRKEYIDYKRESYMLWKINEKEMVE